MIHTMVGLGKVKISDYAFLGAPHSDAFLELFNIA